MEPYELSGDAAAPADLIEVRDQPGKQVHELLCFVFRESIQRITIPFEQGFDGVGHAALRGLREDDTAASAIFRMGRSANPSVTLHASEHLRHRRLFDLGETGQVALRACLPIPQRDQHRQLTDAESEGLETCLAQAGESSCRKADEVSWG